MQTCVDMVALVVVVVGDHLVMDVPCVLGTLACCDGLCRCIVRGVGLDPDLGYGDVSSWFEEMVVTMSWIAWLQILVGSFDSNGLVVMVMRVWLL
jgi:hypothetical protein